MKFAVSMNEIAELMIYMNVAHVTENESNKVKKRPFNNLLLLHCHLRFHSP